MSDAPKKTPQQRRLQRYGTKRYAMDEMRHLLRKWAKAKRTRAPDYSRWLFEYEDTQAYGHVLGARGALRSVGALTDAQYERLSRRIDRIIHAKVTRRPFAEVRRAA